MRRRRRGHARGGWRRKPKPRVPKVWTCRRCGCRGAPKFFGRKVNGFAWCTKCNQSKKNDNNNNYNNKKNKKKNNNNNVDLEKLKEFLLAMFSLIVENGNNTIEVSKLKEMVNEVIIKNKTKNKKDKNAPSNMVHPCSVCYKDFKAEMMIKKKVCRSCIKEAKWCVGCKTYLHHVSFSKSQLNKTNSNCMGCVQFRRKRED